MTDTLLQYRDRIERPLLLVLGSFFAVVGLVTLLLLAASSQRLPAPPAVVDRLIPFVDLSGASSGSMSLPMFGFLLLWGVFAFLAGLRYVVGGLSPGTGVQIRSEETLTREVSDPQGAVVALVVYGVVVTVMVVGWTSASFDRPASILQQAGELFSRTPALLALLVVFGAIVLVFTLFGTPKGRDQR